MEWSKYQQAVFTEAARLTDEDCAVVARAGCAKTTSLIESLRTVPYHRVLLSAFNKSIQVEMQNRAPRHVHCRTLHSLGLRIHQDNLQLHNRGRAEVVPEKGREMAMKLLEEKPQYYRGGNQAFAGDYERKIDAVVALRKTTSFAKNVLALEHDELLDIANNCDLPSREDADKIARAAAELLNREADDYLRVDFDDMAWFPWMFEYGVADGTHMPDYDVVMVDERQDTSPAQDWMIEQIARSGRTISFLDDRQCIYGFRGVDRATVERIVKNANVVKLPLPVSYRCPLAVIEKARLVVPDIEPAPNAEDGHVELTEYDDLLDNARVGDFILSRTNAPLMATCLRLLQQGMPAVVAGRDIGESLRKLLKRSKAKTIPDLHRFLQVWLTKEHKRFIPEYPNKYERSQDRAACLDAVSRFCQTPREVDEWLQRMFSDAEPTDLIVCSTVHKAKGLERDRVWMLSATFGYPNVKPWQDAWSEENIWYVAVTRAHKELYFVETPLDEMGTRSTVDNRRQRQVDWR